MTDKEKEGVAHLEMLLDYGILASEDEPHIETVLNLIEKQAKVIDEMAIAFSNINEIRMMQGEAYYISPEEIKKKFYRKAERR